MPTASTGASSPASTSPTARASGRVDATAKRWPRSGCRRRSSKRRRRTGSADVLPARNLRPRVWSEKVPSVPLEIEKHGNPAVWLVTRRRDEPHTSGDHALVRSVEIVDTQEHSHAAGELLA